MAIYQLPKKFHSDFARQGITPTGPVELDRLSKFGYHAVVSLIPALDQNQAQDNSNSTHLRSVGLGGIGSKYFAQGRTQLNSSFNSQLNLQTITSFVTFELLSAPSGANYLLNHGARLNITSGREGVTSGRLGVSYYDGGAFRSVDLDASPTLGALYTIVFSKAQGSTPIATIFKNGKHVTTSSFGNTSDIVYDNTRQFTLGSRGTWGSLDNNSVINVYHGGVLGAALNESQIRSFGVNTYQILKPKTPAFYFTAETGGGSFTLAANSGSYTVSGADASLITDRSLSAVSGGYSYTGTAADILTGFSLDVDSGAYSYSGTATDLIKDSVLVSDSGTYTYSGTAATLTFTAVGSFTLVGESGSYSYSGTISSLTADRVLVSPSGAYTYSGTAATFSPGFSLAVDSGSYAYAGTVVDFSSNKVLSADNGAYVYNGNNAALTFTPIAPDIPIADGVTVSGIFGNGVAYSATFGNGATVKGKL